MDETGQPGTPPASYGDGADGAGPNGGHANGWEPEPNGSRRDGLHHDAPRSAVIPGSLRTAEPTWSSAGAALEPSDQSGNGWRQAVAASLRGRPDMGRPEPEPPAQEPPRAVNGTAGNGGRPRYSDLIAPLSPPVPPPPVTHLALAGDPGGTPASAPPFPYEGDLEDEPRRPWAPPAPAGPHIPAGRAAEPAHRHQPFGPRPVSPAPEGVRPHSAPPHAAPPHAAPPHATPPDEPRPDHMRPELVRPQSGPPHAPPMPPMGARLSAMGPEPTRLDFGRQQPGPVRPQSAPPATPPPVGPPATPSAPPPGLSSGLAAPPGLARPPAYPQAHPPAYPQAQPPAQPPAMPPAPPEPPRQLHPQAPRAEYPGEERATPTAPPGATRQAPSWSGGHWSNQDPDAGYDDLYRTPDRTFTDLPALAQATAASQAAAGSVAAERALRDPADLERVTSRIPTPPESPMPRLPAAVQRLAPQVPAAPDPGSAECPPEHAAAAAQAASAVRAAAAGVAAAEAQAAAEDHARVQAAFAEAVEAGGQEDEPIRSGRLGQSRPLHPVGPPAPAGPPAPVGPPIPLGPPAPVGPPAPLGPPTPLGQPSLADFPRQPNGLAESASAAGGGYGRPAAGYGSPLPIPPTLPQRIPSAPDVPDVPDDEPYDDLVEQGPAPAAELARIATRLRNDDGGFEEGPDERPDGFDVEAVLAAVRGVNGVRDAQLKPNPGGVHTLRLDLADGADPGEVSRAVARLLKQKMGLAAEPRRQPAGTPPPNLGQPHRDSSAMPVAGAAPAPRIPLPTTATEQLGGPAAANAGTVTDERPRRRHVAAAARGVEAQPEPRRIPRRSPGARVVIDQVQVSTLGLDATVEVRLTSGGLPAIGVASGPSVDGYVLRMAAVAAANAIDQLLESMHAWEQPGRCFVEHATVVPFGSAEVAVVVVLLVCGGVAEQLTGSALVAGDPRQAVVRATLAAVNRRLDALLA